MIGARPPLNSSSRPWEVAVVGGGLAGGLLALELARLGMAVVVVDAGAHASATALSYGLMTLPDAAAWVGLQRRHGPLGLRWRWARLASDPPLRRGPARWLERLPLPVAQVEAPVFLAALPAALAAAGVELRPGRVRRLDRAVPGPAPCGWSLLLENGATLAARQVVLAAGSGCRDLWPELDPRFRVSWAGVLELDGPPPRLARWPAQMVLPRHFRRLELERRAGSLDRRQWVVDAALVIRAGRWLAGQLSLVDPAGAPAELAEPLEGPAPLARLEAELREGLARLDRRLHRAPGRYVQAPVTFCSDGQPMAGAVPGAAGLWVCGGFTAAFSQVPRRAPALAEAIAQYT